MILKILININRIFWKIADYCVAHSLCCLIGFLVLSAAVKLLVHLLDPVIGRDASLYCHIAQCWFDEGSWENACNLGNGWLPPLLFFLMKCGMSAGFSATTVGWIINIICGTLCTLTGYGIALEATKNKFLGQLELEKQSKTYNISNSIYGIQNQLNSMENACKNHDSKELSRLITAFYISKGLVYQKSGFVFTQLIVVMGGLLLVVMALLFFYRITYARRIEIEKILKATNKGQEEERRRISLELHDSVAQQMRYVSILAEKISDKDLSKEIKRNQSECIENIRNACYTLSSINIDKRSFESVLKNAMDNFQKRTKINTSLVITPDSDFNLIPQSFFHHIFRIILELLTNIEKHSRATEVTVLIRNSLSSDKIQSGLMIFVSDDGQGIDEKTLETLNSKRIENAKNLHFGVQNIKLRLNEINGTIKYYSEKGEGTEVKLCIKN